MSAYARIVKPAFDFIGAFVLAVVTLPLMLLLVPVVRIAFGGILRREQRVGRDGEIFTIYKLRTAREENGDSIRDPDLTTLGRILRISSLDEFPQLWNVLKGDMSMVGPRPEDPETVAGWQPWQLIRHQIKPGVTGLWQVTARANGQKLSDNIHLDINYLDQLSFRTDTKIILATFGAILLDGLVRPAAARDKGISRYGLVITDSLLWAGALIGSLFARPVAEWASLDLSGLWLTIALAAGIQLAWGIVIQSRQGRFALGSFEEFSWVAAGTAFTTSSVVVLFSIMATNMPAPRSVVVIAGAFQLLMAASVRYIARSREESKRMISDSGVSRVLVFGTGDAGTEAVKAMRTDVAGTLNPVAFLSDTPSPASVLKLPVVGGSADIATAAARYAADTLLIADPALRGSEIAQIADPATELGLQVRILPRLSDVIADKPFSITDIRELQLSDFLARDEIDIDLDTIGAYIRGKRVLVTGAGGSIGSVLCETITDFEPEVLFKLDRDENALHGLQLLLEKRALLQSPELILCDIRDADAVQRVFEELRPEVIFHTAAHKHVTFLQRYPLEAVKTNVFGTLNVLSAAQKVGVERFVNVSTDKAADPVNMLGITKRIGEALTAHFAGLDEGVYISTRFGNVLGSKGSVIPTFQRQIENGDPITVTDPDVTRYFMTIEEAVQLVVQAGAIGGDGDVHVFDMGEPVPIVQLARRIAAVVKPGVEPEIVYTGLRPGEKLHEVLSGDSEPVIDQPHPLLHRFVVPRLDPMVLSLLQLQELRDHEAFEAVLGEWLNQAQYPPSTSGQAAG